MFYDDVKQCSPKYILKCFEARLQLGIILFFIDLLFFFFSNLIPLIDSNVYTKCISFNTYTTINLVN